MLFQPLARTDLDAHDVRERLLVVDQKLAVLAQIVCCSFITDEVAEFLDQRCLRAFLVLDPRQQGFKCWQTIPATVARV